MIRERESPYLFGRNRLSVRIRETAARDVFALSDQ
jgi:hypothetical protein